MQLPCLPLLATKVSGARAARTKEGGVRRRRPRFSRTLAEPRPHRVTALTPALPHFAACFTFAPFSRAEIEGIFTVLLSFLDEVPAAAEAQLVAVIKAMGAAVGAVTEGKQVALRLRL